MGGRFTVSPRLMLEVSTGQAADTCLNEVVVQRTSCRIASFAVSADGMPVLSQRADALIVSTPTGSTAHLLAAGGPVLVPETDAVVLLPIAPHTLACRPAVFPSRTVFSINVRSACEAVCDGQRVHPLQPAGTLTVKASPEKVNLILERDQGFFEKLSDRFGWGLSW